jgi:hypothetical protein
MIRRTGWLVIMTALGFTSAARAQAPSAPRVFWEAPGRYGMAWGTPGFGTKRDWSSFSSPYGLGYGYGYAPSGYVPGRYGVGLWRPDLAGPGYRYGSAFYSTFPYPYTPTAPVAPVGVYAPAFGPPSFTVW